MCKVSYVEARKRNNINKKINSKSYEYVRVTHLESHTVGFAYKYTSDLGNCVWSREKDNLMLCYQKYVWESVQSEKL